MRPDRLTPGSFQGRISARHGRVAELVDALVSGTSGSNPMRVRVSPRPPNKKSPTGDFLFESTSNAIHSLHTNAQYPGIVPQVLPFSASFQCLLDSERGDIHAEV